MSRVSVFLIAALAASVGTIAAAQEAPQRLQQMVGTWQVQQRMWPAPGAEAVDLPPAVARRQLIDGKYLQEVMESSGAEAGQSASFRRHAFINYNAVARRYEYTSLDTRAPQLMTELGSRITAEPAATETLKLQGGVFLAPEWGNTKDVPFKYRLTVGAVKDGRQTVQLYLLPQAVLPKKEFLAFEYVYTRRP